MPSLRDYRDRIKSVKSTRKITSAMKMVAASKLRKAQEQAERSQPYAISMSAMLSRLAAGVVSEADAPKLLAGTGSQQKHLLIVITADRGLCGGFNANPVKETRLKIRELESQGKDVEVIFVGRKGFDAMKRECASNTKKLFRDIFGKKRVEYAQAANISEFVLNAFEAGEFDVCTLIYNEFHSILVQKPITQQLIPFEVADDVEPEGESKSAAVPLPYSFEPGEEEILSKLLPRNVGVQIFRAMLDSSAGEHAARMTAMDNATRNAGDMINDLTLKYNRARQAYITKELIEIISGAEAV